VAVHCGGWDKIDGGKCTHAWAMLTGCRHQYTMTRGDAEGSGYNCFGNYLKILTRGTASLGDSDPACPRIPLCNGG